jgi:myo-inositol-1(or 4)-monophosphatase
LQVPSPAEDRDLLIHAADLAGQIARKFHRTNPRVWDKADGAGPVTEADLEIDKILRDRLLAARPNYGWLSEETEDSPDRLSKSRVFVVDPIDGTQAFIDGTSAFAHSLAVVENGRPIAAVVYLPVQEKLYAAATGSGATLNDDVIQANDARDGSKPRVLATRHTMTERYWPVALPDIERVYRPSLAYRMALVGEGRMHGMATFRATWEWDIAAGALIIEEAGGITSDGHGRTLRFNNPTPQVDGVLTATKRLHGELLRARGY